MNYPHPLVKFRIPMPWTGVYYAINWDEMRPGRMWLCFTWWGDFRCKFFGFGLIPYFPAQKEGNP